MYINWDELYASFPFGMRNCTVRAVGCTVSLSMRWELDLGHNLEKWGALPVKPAYVAVATWTCRVQESVLQQLQLAMIPSTQQSWHFNISEFMVIINLIYHPYSEESSTEQFTLTAAKGKPFRRGHQQLPFLKTWCISMQKSCPIIALTGLRVWLEESPCWRPTCTSWLPWLLSSRGTCVEGKEYWLPGWTSGSGNCCGIITLSDSCGSSWAYPCWVPSSWGWPGESLPAYNDPTLLMIHQYQ